MPNFARIVPVLCISCVGSAFGDDLAFEEKQDRLVLTDQERVVLEFVHNPPPGATDDEFVPTHYVHPLKGLLGEDITGDSPSLWGGAPGVHWAWSRLGLGNTLVNIENGSGARRVFERWLGAEVQENVAAFSVQSAWITDSTGEAKVIENLTARIYPVTGSTRYIDVSVLIRNISDSIIVLEGGLPGSGLGITLNPERTDWGFANSAGWVRSGEPYMSPWTLCTYRDERRSTRSGLAILQDSRNPAYSTANWIVEDGPRVIVGTPESYKTELKSTAFIEFRYRLILFRVIGGGPDMTEEFTKFMGAATSAN